MHVRMNVTVALAAAMTVIGCGSSGSSGPKPNDCAVTATTTSFATSQALAIHLDSAQAQAASCNQAERAQLLTYPIAALAENVTPAQISLTVNGAAAAYSAVGLEIVGQTAGANPTPSDSFLVFVAWSDANASQLFFLSSLVPDTAFDAWNVSGANANEINTVTSLAVSLVTSGPSCGTPVSLPFSSGTDLIASSTCTQAVTSQSFNIGFTATGTNPNTSYAYSSTSIPSVRLLLSSGGGQLRIPHAPALGLERHLKAK
jgi:hypothetical protein